jgi:creatinine amidohydrolase
VKRSGFHKLVFFTTSPWNEELVDAASRDVRVSLGLQTFLIHLSSLGVGFHPASPRRAEAQAAAAHLLQAPPAPNTRAAEISDADFRPGSFRQPAPLAPDTTKDGRAILETAAQRLAQLLAEVHARGPLGSMDHRSPAAIAPATQPAAADLVFPLNYRQHYLGALTRDELERIPNKDRALVILPTGSIEQHGHHLPVGVDSILGQAWLENVLPRLAPSSPVFAAPPLTYGKSNEHENFAGTLTISAKTLRRLLLSAATQLKALGFHRLAILNTHGGNSAVIVYTLREIQTTLGLGAGLLGWPYKPELPPQEAAFGFHAGEWETSLMLAVAPELVDMSKAVCEYPARLTDPGELRPESAPATFSWATQDISRSGVMGDAPAATLEKGRRWLAAASTALAARIEQLLRPR